MEVTKVNMAFFSATGSTKKVLENIVEGLGDIQINKIDVTKGSIDDILLANNELMIVGMPVYAGRIPAMAAEALLKIKGNCTPAIIVCVYGNRDYDDALLELKDITEANGFKVISAGAFVAQHSIFPQVANGRPDENDKNEAIAFGRKNWELLNSIQDINQVNELMVKGNHPYKVPKAIPLKPKGNYNCNNCGTCVKQCPTGAISKDKPRKTDKSKCISCGRCIAVCPQHARNFRGILYRLVAKQFSKKCAQKKVVETFFA